MLAKLTHTQTHTHTHTHTRDFKDKTTLLLKIVRELEMKTLAKVIHARRDFLQCQMFYVILEF
jgi:cytoplasmic iron level regulating protein YaaA (DUF328/UPF0246 family)